MKRVADAEFEAGTPERAEFGFREQTIAMSDPDQPMEAAFERRVVVESEDVEGGASTDIEVPHRERRREAGSVGRQFIDELEIQPDEREVVSDAEFDIRPESQMLD